MVHFDQMLTLSMKTFRSRIQSEALDRERLGPDDRCLIPDEIVDEREEAPAARSNICRHRVASSCTKTLRFLSR